MQFLGWGSSLRYQDWGDDEGDIEWALNLSSNIEGDEDRATLFEMLHPIDWYSSMGI